MYEYRRLTVEQRAEVVRERLARGYPPHQPPHPIRDQVCYLITAACYEHRALMKAEARRQQLLDLLFERFTDCGVELRGWVVLPNHYHLLVYLGGEDCSSLGEGRERVGGGEFDSYQRIGKVIRVIHGALARSWNSADGTAGRKVWCRYSDRVIRSERHYYTTLNYIHYNPVKHGWSVSPYDWSGGSIHWYLAEKGREWLRDSWVRYPVKDYGKDWDEVSDAD
ncbi:hypothetical protein [Prochlorothrix hollandica]|uniref:Transposase n=2 Tax=Prochlorothrix hollandica TaxID=1223 RepID=A0A0M2PYH3_PROHO|nr:hypothetical protein [Prochlorothrix hollandica]KKJ00133.1 transposase [Prochlorothrix hollandica PCC 9006 = CALU 1027]